MNVKISHDSRQECSIALAMSAEWSICAIENFLILRSGDVDVLNNMDGQFGILQQTHTIMSGAWTRSSHNSWCRTWTQFVDMFMCVSDTTHDAKWDKLII
jgi:hypothetical protein